MTELPPTFDHAALPSAQEVRDWWDRYCMFDNIRAHSEMVRLVALTLWDWLDESGLTLNRQAVEVGALAHDLAKTECIKNGGLHAQVGEEMLLKLGYPELGYLVGNHVYLPPEHPMDETAVVNYADKRVMHDTIVDLKTRFEYIEERYGQGQPERLERIGQGYRWAMATEDALFSIIDHGRRPDDLMALNKNGTDS